MGSIRPISGTERAPHLDAIRGAAVLAVLVYHATLGDSLPGVRWGWLGVEAFFVLSGVLIGRQLCAGIRLDAYAVRRATRIYPLLLVYCLPLLAWEPLLGVDLVLRASGNRPDPNPVLWHLWSVQLEVACYVAAPVLIRLRCLPALACVATLAKLATMQIGDLALLVRVDAFLWGLVLATDRLSRTDATGMLVGGAALLVGACHADMPQLASLGAVVVTAGAIALEGWAGPRWLRWCGERSYGIYVLGLAPTLLLPAVPAIALAFALAEASWRFVERPTLRWGRRYSSRAPTGVPQSSSGVAHGSRR